jgi:hypothetical protein
VAATVLLSEDSNVKTTKSVPGSKGDIPELLAEVSFTPEKRTPRICGYTP